MLRWRLILGVTFIAALVGLFYLDAWLVDRIPLPPGVILVPLALTVTGAAAREFSDLVKKREPEFDGTLLAVGSWMIVASPWLGACVGGKNGMDQWNVVVTIAVFIFAFLMEMKRYDKDSSKNVSERLGLMLFGLVYLGIGMSFVVRLRLLPAGMLPLISMLVVVKMGDIGAYTIGRLFGRNKLAPRLSPGKTWEGFFGGLAFSGIAGVLFGEMSGIGFVHSDVIDSSVSLVGPTYVPVWRWFLSYALVVSAVGVLGDLAESLIKRDYGVKDSSTWMPGFGGVLDLIDSPLFAAPVAWAFWEFGGLVR